MDGPRQASHCRPVHTRGMTDATKLRLAAQFASYAIPPGHEARSDIGPKRAKKGPQNGQKRAQKGAKKGPKRGQKGPILRCPRDAEKRQKMAFFGTLWRKVQGEWGGSAHSPDPTAQSASAPQPPASHAVRQARGGGQGGSGGGGGQGGRGVGGPPGWVGAGFAPLGWCNCLFLVTTRRLTPGRGCSGRSLSLNSVRSKGTPNCVEVRSFRAPRSL